MGKSNEHVFVDSWRRVRLVEGTNFGVELTGNFEDSALRTKASLFQLWRLVLAPIDCVGRSIRRVVATTPFVLSRSPSAHQAARTSELQS